METTDNKEDNDWKVIGKTVENPETEKIRNKERKNKKFNGENGEKHQEK